LVKRSVLLVVLLLLAGLLLTSCGPKEPEGEQVGEEEGSKYGGILRFAYYAPTNTDPAFLSTVADEHIARQWAEYLVFVDEENRPDPNRSVAESWDVSEDGLLWTFKLRQGIKFHDGKEMTSRDVKFTFDRLRDPEIGAATVTTYANIVDITTPDDYTVVFQLENPNPDFLMDLFDYHALIVDADQTDFNTTFNGTGPFIVDRYIPEDRIVFKRVPSIIFRKFIYPPGRHQLTSSYF